MTNTYDLSGLGARLKKLEPEFRKVEEEEDVKSRAQGCSKAWLQTKTQTIRDRKLKNSMS